MMTYRLAGMAYTAPGLSRECPHQFQRLGAAVVSTTLGNTEVPLGVCVVRATSRCTSSFA